MAFRLILLIILGFIIISYFRKLFRSDDNSTSGNKRSDGNNGNVSVDDAGKNKGSFRKDAGEYVDYEEVD